MTAPVIFYMFINAFAQLVISDSLVTTLMFDETISKHYLGASKKEIFIKKTKDRKKLILRGVGREVNTNLLVEMDSGKVYSFLIRKGDRPHSIVAIKDGKKDSLYKEIINTKLVRIEEGNYTTKVFNNSNKSITVNSIMISNGNNYNFPKGTPLFLDNKRIYR